MSNFVQTERLDQNRIRILSDLEIVLFANEQVPVDRASLQETLTISEIKATIAALNRLRFFGDYDAAINRAVLTPDFHKGSGIPIGTVLDADGLVLPQCVGTDVSCGMRLITTDMTREDFARCVNLENILRHAFFEGGRDIPFSEAGRLGMLREGVIGLKPLNVGIWNHIDQSQMFNELDHTHQYGSWPTKDLWMFADYVKGSGGVSRDSAIGSIGGGNHFDEIQYVEECLDKPTCQEWGIREGMITVMAHTGSVGLGSMVGDHFVQLARKLHPTSLKMPKHAYHPLPTVGPLAAHGDAYLSAMGLAANFATVNRLMIGAVTLRCLSDALGRAVHGRLVYDAPHNLVWSKGQHHLHRKGATPADCDPDDAVFPNGHPVIVPGSMGDASYILRGRGSLASLCSAPHGAGRLMARGEARKASPDEMQLIRVVTKIDLNKVRRDIADEYRRDLMEEAPSQYKPVLPVIETVANAGIASPVARLRPLLTVKG
jgi:tRNA-splicing ligase RtcB